MSLTAAVHAEWTKLRTVSETRWLLLGTVAVVVLVSTATAASVSYRPGASQDPVRIGLNGVGFGQVLVVVLAAQMAGGEYGNGVIRTTLAATPRRATVLAAKAATLAAVVLAAGTAAVLGSLVTARLILPGNGFPDPALALADGSVLRAATGSILYLVLVGLLSLGVTVALRDTAVATGTALGILYLFPVVATVVDDPDWQRRLERIAPMNAGLAVQRTVDVADLPISPWAGVAVLTAWAAAALLTAATLLHRRDA